MPKRDAIDRPIFVIGTGRSGTTLFLRLLGLHPSFAWFSNYASLFPRVPALALLSRILDTPIGNRLIRAGWRYTPAPTETYSILDGVTDGLFTAPHRLEASHVSEAVRARYRRRVLLTLRWQGKPRFLQKHTGFARSRFLQAIFPEARFIHIVRDGRASALSLAKVDWWKGIDSWRWGPMKPDYALEWKRSGKHRLVLAAISWKTLMDEIEDETRELSPERLLTIRYGDLVSTPRATLEQALRFAELTPSDTFLRRLEASAVRADMDEKWGRELDPDDRKRLEDSLGPHLRKFGFEDG